MGGEDKKAHVVMRTQASVVRWCSGTGRSLAYVEWRSEAGQQKTV